MSLQAFAELNQITDQSLLDTKVQEFNRGVSELWDRLMGLELQLVDQLEVGARNESCHEKTCFLQMQTTNEPRHEKTNILHKRKQRCRSASR